VDAEVRHSDVDNAQKSIFGLLNGKQLGSLVNTHDFCNTKISWVVTSFHAPSTQLTRHVRKTLLWGILIN
jgi:hypothetical protein